MASVTLTMGVVGLKGGGGEGEEAVGERREGKDKGRGGRGGEGLVVEGVVEKVGAGVGGGTKKGGVGRCPWGGGRRRTRIKASRYCN